MEERQTQANFPTYCGWSIFSTLCCCLPLGIVAIVYSNKVESANLQGDVAGAKNASETAKALNIAALICGIIFISIYVAIRVSQHQ